jgi:hypothetical protein
MSQLLTTWALTAPCESLTTQLVGDERVRKSVTPRTLSNGLRKRTVLTKCQTGLATGVEVKSVVNDGGFGGGSGRKIRMSGPVVVGSRVRKCAEFGVDAG